MLRQCGSQYFVVYVCAMPTRWIISFFVFIRYLFLKVTTIISDGGDLLKKVMESQLKGRTAFDVKWKNPLVGSQLGYSPRVLWREI